MAKEELDIMEDELQNSTGSHTPAWEPVLAAPATMRRGSAAECIPTRESGNDDVSVPLPNGWAYLSLQNIAIYVNGRAFKPSEWKGAGQKIIRIQNLNDKNAKFNFTDLEHEDKYRVYDGDILYAWSASLGAHIWRGEEAWLNQHIFKVIPNLCCSSKFIYYLLTHITAEIYKKTHGSGMVHVTKGKFETTPINLPPLNEQTRIVAKLEELFSDLDAGVAALQRAKANLKRYRAAVLKAAVEGKLTAQWREQNPPTETGAQLLARILKERRVKWEENQLKKFAEQGKTPPKNWQDKYPEPAKPDTSQLPKLPEGWVWATTTQLSSGESYSLAIGPFGSNLKISDYQEEGVPLVFVRNVRSAVFFGNKPVYVTEAKAAELKAHQVSAEDILITKMGEPPGDVCLYPSGAQNAIITADCIKFRLSAILKNKYYFVHAIEAKPVHQQILKVTKGVAQQKITLAGFNKVAIPLSPLSEQHEITSEISRRLSIADATDKTLDHALARTARLRQAILKRAFEGKLVPQDPNDEPASLLLESIRAERDKQQEKLGKSAIKRKPVIPAGKQESSHTDVKPETLNNV